MPIKKRVRSIQVELVKKAREAALSAVQTFNNPLINFKSEIFIVTMCIAWTYLIHAYYRKNRIEYRYYKKTGIRKIFEKTKYRAHKYWELEKCLDSEQSPMDEDTKRNLKFLIGIRHEIEHQMTSKIDNYLSAKFQSCCLNFNKYIKKLFGDENGIDKYLSLSLQFISISEEQITELKKHASELPKNVKSFIYEFEKDLSPEQLKHENYAYRVIFVPKLVNHEGQADTVIEFVKADSELGKKINTEYALIKETERIKYKPQEIVNIMIADGYPKFNMHSHTSLWKTKNAKNPSTGLGNYIDRDKKEWRWYEPWINLVKKHCQENQTKYQ